ncbi:MAG: hypothetical protein D3906_11565 [Candidatus Electrothrix sp. AUS1_2]|nr:hypothetical protein [Candidatus Electrothrix sp. AUS1_2]
MINHQHTCCRRWLRTPLVLTNFGYPNPPEVRVLTGLPAITGSAVTSLEISVNNYDALVDMIRNHYSGRLVDVLEVKTS